MDSRHVAERWGSAEFTHTLAQISWMASPAVLLHLNRRSTGDPARDWLSGWARRFFVGHDLRVLVLGCGEGWLERALAAWPFVASIDAVDVAPAAVSRAEETARSAGLTQIRYGVVDLNRDVLSTDAYDVVVAHSILHHVEDLEHAFGEIESAMKSDATLIVNEYVGPNRFQFSDEVLQDVNDVLRCFPLRLRRSALDASTYERKERPAVETVVAADPSEAIRSSELRQKIAERFEILDRRELGGTLLQHLLYDVVQNFRFDEPRERAMIELACSFEELLLDRGVIGSDFTLFAARKRSSILPRSAYNRKPPARSPAARDVDRDPLGLGRCIRRRSGGARTAWLPAWALRMLRVVLASTVERRRNLIAEGLPGAAVEQLRYAAARRTGVFDWIIGRWLAVADPESEDDRAILALLETFERIVCEKAPIGR